MGLVYPFAGFRPGPEHAQDVISPPYDVVTREQAFEFAQNKAHNFLRLSRPEITLDNHINFQDDRVYEQGKKNLEQLLANKIITQDISECFYAYQIETPVDSKLGFIGLVDGNAYISNRLKKHELTRPAKEQDRIKHLQTQRAQLSPVLLTYRARKDLAKVLTTITQKPVTISVQLAGNTHRLWRVVDKRIIQFISETMDKIDYLYIADGHHRAAASASIKSHLLAAMFPDNEMSILGYHRLIKQLHQTNTRNLIKQLKQQFNVYPQPECFLPNEKYNIGMYLDKQWYLLKCINQPEENRLDCQILTDQILKPMLNIKDIRTDENIEFIGGLDGAKHLQNKIDSNGYALGFTLFPTSMSELLATADKDEVMPPKSTWFEPKLVDGLVSYFF